MQRLQLYRLIGRAGTITVLFFVAMNLLAIAFPIASALVAGWLVGEVAQGRPGILFAPVVAFGALVVARQIIEPFEDAARLRAVENIDLSVRSTVRRISLAILDRRVAETVELREDINRASHRAQSGTARTAGHAAVGQAVLTFRILSGAAASFIVATFMPLLGIGLLLAALLIRMLVRRQWIWLSTVSDENTAPLMRSGYIAYLLTSHDAAKEVRVFSLGEWLTARWHDLAWEGELGIAATKSVVLNRQGVTILLGAVTAASFFLLPGLGVINETLTTQGLVRVVVAAFAVSELAAMGFEAWDIAFGQEAASALSRLESVTLTTVQRSEPFPTQKAGATVSMKDVVFAFEPGRPVLNGVSIDIKSNEVVGFVGANGVGKSTLMKVLAGLYPVESGVITVDGLRNTQDTNWFRQFAIVQQGFVRYPGSVRSNIRFGAPELTEPDDEGIWSALRRAGLQEEIERMPLGLDTPLWSQRGGHENLSGGQWQRLALARGLFALAHGRRVLVLDEPTSQLDAPSEAAFFQQVIEAVRDRTVILISHRLSTIRYADRIYFLDRGLVREEGTHDQLLAIHGEYSRLFALQASRFGPDEGELK